MSHMFDFFNFSLQYCPSLHMIWLSFLYSRVIETCYTDVSLLGMAEVSNHQQTSRHNPAVIIDQLMSNVWIGSTFCMI